MRSRRPTSAIVLGLVLVSGGLASIAPRDATAQEPGGPRTTSQEALAQAIDQLGNLDYDTRTEAARIVRRTEPRQAVPTLIRTVQTHADGYVRFRALVLLTGFNDPQTGEVMRDVVTSPNDRLRNVAYTWYAHNPEPSMADVLLRRLDTELAEFVRPALVRALAAHGDSAPAVRNALLRDVMRGEDFFRSAVIEALGEFRAEYAFDALASVARLDGPLQDDAALALGRIGDKRALPILAELQETAPRDRQPMIAAAICLLGINCGSHEPFIVQSLEFADANPGFQALLRSSAGALGALGVAGRRTAVEALLRIGIPSRDPTTAPVALALGAVALRNTPLLFEVLSRYPDRDGAIRLLRDGFDMLEEDFEQERFFALARRTYWAVPEGSPTRELMQTLIDRLDF